MCSNDFKSMNSLAGREGSFWCSIFQSKGLESQGTKWEMRFQFDFAGGSSCVSTRRVKVVQPSGRSPTDWSTVTPLCFS
jgi:hypothetical protein